MIPTHGPTHGTAIYNAVLFVWLGSEVWIAVRTLSKRAVHGAPAALRQDRFSGPALIGGILLSVWAGIGVASALPGAAMPAARAVFIVGAVLALLGVALRVYAVTSLGRWFELRVTTSSDQPVVESGPYRFVRHPSYTGVLLTVLGVQLMLANWLSLACFVIAWPGFAYRIAVEEAALASGIGAPYRDYMKRTRRLIPFVL